MNKVTTRSKLYAQIHIAKKQLLIEEDDYRALLLRVTNQDSLKSCSFAQLHLVIEHFKKMGFQNINKSQAMPNPSYGKDQRNKILSLWIELADLGIVKNRNDDALASYCKKICKIEHWHWLDSQNCSKVIETLKKWKQRVLKERVSG